MSRSACVLLYLFAVWSGTARGADQSVILIWVNAGSQITPPGAEPAITEFWANETQVLNPNPNVVGLEVLEILPPDPGLSCRAWWTPLPPGRTSGFACYGTPQAPYPSVRFMRVRSSDRIASSDELIRTRVTCPDISNPVCDWRELGRSPLPVFDGTFPAGSTALAGAVGLGNKDDPTTRRRLNITLANYGESPATFRITIHPLNSAPGNAITSFDQVVPARDVLQLNDVRFDWGNAPTGWNSTDKIWVSVTADQPYLFYVSTVLVQQDPGTMPFEVLKPTLLPGPLP